MTSIPTREIQPSQGPPGLPAVFRPQPSGVSGVGGGPTGKDILRVLRKRFWLITITACGIIILTCAATGVWWLYAPLYTAEADLLVTPPAGNELRPGAPIEYSQEIMSRIMLTHAAMAQSDQVLNAATEDPDVVRTAWYNRNKKDVVIRLHKDIEVSPVAGTNYIRISMTGLAANEQQKKELADIVNAVASKFESFSKQAIAFETGEDIKNTQTQLDKLQTDLANVRTEITRQAAAGSVQERRQVVAGTLNRLASEAIPLALFKAQAEASLSFMEQQVKDGTVKSSPDVLQALDMDPQLRTMRTQVDNLSAELQRKQTKFAPGHDQVKTTASLLEGIRTQLQKREGETTERAIGQMIGERKVQLESATSQLVALEDKLKEAQAEDADLQSRLNRMDQLTTNEKELTNRIATYNDRLALNRLRAGGEQQVKRAIPAVPPREISMPKWKIMIPLGIFVGVAVGLGLAFLLEVIDTSIKGPSDIARRVDLPLLGMVPHTDDVEEPIEDVRLAFLGHPTSLVGEAFRQIRTCLMFSGPPSQRRSLLVTSPLPEDGRTTVAMNLAACCAQGGRKVLVVDANFRQPAIRELFPQCPEGGLSSALVGQANWRDMVYQVQPGLDVLPAGVLPPNPAELLGSEQMRQFLEETAEAYEQVIIDGAPCLLVSDSPILSTLVDGVILTVRAGANTYGIVQRARDVLQRVGAHVVGAVLNAVRASAGGYLRENYDRFYEYHEQRSIAAQ